MNVEGSICICLVKPSEEPGEAIVRLDVVGRVGQPLLTDKPGA